MSAQHTQGRLLAVHEVLLLDDGSGEFLAVANLVGCDNAEPNARRLVACWNALEDLPQEALDGGWSRAGLEAYGKRMEAQRDELIVALREIAEASFDPDVVQCARAAIAKAEGGAA